MEDSDSIKLKLLGGWEVNFRGSSPLVGCRQQRLIAALAIYGRRSRNALSGLLWPDCTEARAMGSLRAAVYTVSHRLPGLLEIRGRDLDLGDAVDVDLHHVRSALKSVSSAPADMACWSASPLDVELLPGWYDEWVLEEQERLRRRYLNAAEYLAELALHRGDYHHAVYIGQIVFDLDPLRESAVRIIVEAHLATGNHATAVQILQQYMGRLDAELQIGPSQRLLALINPFSEH